MQPVASVDTVVDDTESLRRLERRENFPVALRLLPRRLRAELRAVYDFARTVDDLGDEAAGDRLALLAGFEADLRLAWTDTEPRLPVVQRLVPVVRAHQLAIDPFLGLVAANRLDQQQSSYPTWNDLRHYCTLSADPVGRIVLALTNSVTQRRVGLSDDVCTALQVLEHCQDVGEDYRAGRIYLPQDDLAAYGVTTAHLTGATTSQGLRTVVASQVRRANELLTSHGPGLVHRLSGWARFAVAGYLAGGEATVSALRSADHDVLARTIKPGKLHTAGFLARRLVGR